MKTYQDPGIDDATHQRLLRITRDCNEYMAEHYPRAKLIERGFLQYRDGNPSVELEYWRGATTYSISIELLGSEIISHWYINGEQRPTPKGFPF